MKPIFILITLLSISLTVGAQQKVPVCNDCRDGSELTETEAPTTKEVINGHELSGVKRTLKTVAGDLDLRALENALSAKLGVNVKVIEARNSYDPFERAQQIFEKNGNAVYVVKLNIDRAYNAKSSLTLYQDSGRILLDFYNPLIADENLVAMTYQDVGL